MLGRVLQSFGVKYKKDLPPAVDLDILGIINWPEIRDRNRREGL